MPPSLLFRKRRPRERWESWQLLWRWPPWIWRYDEVRVSHVWVEREGGTSSMARLAILLVCIDKGMCKSWSATWNPSPLQSSKNICYYQQVLYQCRLHPGSHPNHHALLLIVACWITWISKKCLPKQEWAIMVIVCWMYFRSWKIACQHAFSTTSVSCWIT